MTKNFDLVVASHLRWDFVWQRPQQLISRLSENRRVLFIEEPILATDQSEELSPSLKEAAPGIFVLTPRVLDSRPDFAYLWADRETISRQVRFGLRLLDIGPRALWFYTPMPEFLLQAVQPDLVVYDVMDELANFKFAPPTLREQEARLLRTADVVFTGGASLYEAKVSHNRNTHLFPSGVDAKHYSKACLEETEVPELLAGLPGRKATYIGVIDERLDYQLIEALSTARPEIQIVMAGPVVKVDPAELPRAANIHYMGQQPYAALPGILKGTDVCLMPFARNEATKYISPTKTLEYMATHRPIVSTPIRDVERFYSHIVYLAGDCREFIEQVDAAMTEAAEERARRRRQEETVLAENAWDNIAGKMEALMQEAYLRRHRPVRPAAVLARAAQSVRPQSEPASKAPSALPAGAG